MAKRASLSAAGRAHGAAALAIDIAAAALIVGALAAAAWIGRYGPVGPCGALEIAVRRALPDGIAGGRQRVAKAVIGYAGARIRLDAGGCLRALYRVESGRLSFAEER